MEKRHLIKENRRSVRKALFLYLDVFDKRSNELLGHLGNLSEGGLMLLANKPILNRIKHLRIRLPNDKEDIDFEKEFIDVKVEICWTEPDPNPNIHRIGCRFLKVSHADLTIIEELIDDMSL